MRNLIIIGNGFDLAHGIKTSYNDFIEDFFDNKFFKNKNDYSGILECPVTHINRLYELKMYLNRIEIKFKNKFLKLLLQGMLSNNWCDIESKYFEELNYCKSNGKNRYEGRYTKPKELNDDFEVIKKHLAKYLKEEEGKVKKVDSYEVFFKSFGISTDNALILNFNYTRTIENLYGNFIKCPIIHIHGELENEDNPMIFGYAANHEESREFLSKNDKEYMRNIKKHCYKRTDNKNRLHKFLNKCSGKADKYNKIDVFLLGHSCGLSDKLILNEIFNHSDIQEIRTFYYENHENYFDIQVNIDRIMADDEKFDKLMNFQDSNRMPQFNDNDAQIHSFKKYIEEIKKRYPVKPDIGTFVIG